MYIEYVYTYFKKIYDTKCYISASITLRVTFQYHVALLLFCYILCSHSCLPCHRLKGAVEMWCLNVICLHWSMEPVARALWMIVVWRHQGARWRHNAPNAYDVINRGLRHRRLDPSTGHGHWRQRVNLLPSVAHFRVHFRINKGHGRHRIHHCCQLKAHGPLSLGRDRPGLGKPRPGRSRPNSRGPCVFSWHSGRSSKYHTWVWKPLDFARGIHCCGSHRGQWYPQLAPLSTNARAPLVLIWTHLIMTSYSWRFDQVRHLEFSI